MASQLRTFGSRSWVAGFLTVVVLWLMVVISALAVIASTNESRKRLHELELLRREAEQLHVGWGQYLLERAAWGAFSRVEQEASEKLNMKLPDTADVIMVTP